MPTLRPLTPFEQLLLRDQRPGFPMCFFLLCAVEGPLDLHRLRGALERAAGRHPLLCSRVRDAWWRASWQSPDVLPVLEAFPLGSPPPGSPPPGVCHGPWRSIDIRRTSGVRMVAIERKRDAWEVVLMIQHAACDGLSGLEFFGDVWSEYHGSEPAPFRTPTRDVRRRSGSTAAGASPSAAPPSTPPSKRAPTDTGPTVSDLGGETARFAGNVPTMLARGPALPLSPSSASLGAGPSLPFVTVSFTVEETSLIKQRAAADGASLNDVAVAAVMRVVVAWNEDAGHPARQIRITMPASLKAPGTRAPVCNDMGYAFLDRTAKQCRAPVDLVRSLAIASRWIQEHRAAGTFLDTLAIIDRFPPAFWLLTRLPVPLSTAVVSFVGNVGVRLRANVPRDGGCDLPGGLRISAVNGVPPIRPGTRLGVGLVIYDGRLHVTVLGDVHALGEAAPPLLAAAIRTAILDCTASLTMAPLPPATITASTPA